MGWSWARRAAGAGWQAAHLRPWMFVACALMLAACNADRHDLSAAPPRGATVAFDSLDGLPPAQFHRLVQDLNNEAQAKRLAIISREQSSAYRVRGYVAAKVARHETTISWVWDVFDREEARTLRISGEESTKTRHKDAWAAADDEMLQRIARKSIDQLANFLTSADVAPATAPAGEAQYSIAAAPESSPEAAGIFRISQPQVDPIPAEADVAETNGPDDLVPLPKRRPPALISVSETFTLAASGH
ncbi:MAG TPA: hypothetical protein VFP60_02390 [Pseudolabrys sp.]|nr:hypothetical protein [Pseudolabrys sp.]